MVTVTCGAAAAAAGFAVSLAASAPAIGAAMPVISARTTSLLAAAPSASARPTHQGRHAATAAEPLTELRVFIEQPQAGARTAERKLQLDGLGLLSADPEDAARVALTILVRELNSDLGFSDPADPADRRHERGGSRCLLSQPCGQLCQLLDAPDEGRVGLPY